MFQRLTSFLKGLPGPAAPAEEMDGDDPRVAAAALLFHVMDADGVRSDVERVRIRDAVSQAYGVTGAALDALLAAGERADREAVDLYAFTSVLSRHLDQAGRIEFIGIMWQIVYADGELHELEDNTIWRVAELIGVDRRDRIEMRKLARGGEGDDANE